MAKVVRVKASVRKKKKGGVSSVKSHVKTIKKEAKPKKPKPKKKSHFIDSSNENFSLKHLGEGKPILIIDKKSGKVVASADTQGMAANFIHDPEKFFHKRTARRELSLHKKNRGKRHETPIQDSWYKR